MESGGAQRDESFFQQVQQHRRGRVEVPIPNPIRIVGGSGDSGSSGDAEDGEGGAGGEKGKSGKKSKSGQEKSKSGSGR
jgi:hypothetical protein